MKKLFFELMQVGMGQLDCLGRGPTTEEWQGLYELSQREAVAGICYRGAVSLFEYGLRAPQDLIIDWMSESEEIREHNEMTSAKLSALQHQLAQGGMRSSVLSGEGLLAYYGEELFYLRESSSIDLYVKSSKGLGAPGSQEGLDINLMDAVPVGKGAWKSRAMEKWLRQNGEMLFKRNGELMLPVPAMHAVVYLTYLYNRLVSRNLCMRDLMDYYYILRAADGRFEPFDDPRQTVGDVFLSLHLSRFARGVMWMMQEVFGMERRLLPVEPLEAEGKFLLDDVLLSYQVILHWGHLLAHYSWFDLLKS